MPETGASVAGSVCARCGTQLAPALLSCPSCHALVHSERLNALAAQAQAAERAGDPTTASARWHEALELLPPDAGHRTAIEAKLAALGREIDRFAPARPTRASCRTSTKRCLSRTNAPNPGTNIGAVAGMP